MISFIKKHLTLLPFILLFIIYLVCISRDIYGGDVGDFVTTAFLHGIPHPPGYPLFTLLGFIFIKIFFPLSPVVAVSLISSIAATLTVFVYFKFILRITKNISVTYLSSFTLAFSYLFWLYAEVGEVFALNSLLSLSFFVSSYLFHATNKKKYAYLTALLLGLGLSNHHTIVLLIPGVLLFYLPRIKFLLNIKTILISLSLFLLGLSFYLYVPIAASTHPAVNWNGEPTLQNVVNLFTRKIYGTLQATPAGVASIDEKWVLLGSYINTLVRSLSIPVIIFAVFGGIELYKKGQKKLLSAIGVTYLLIGPLFAVYAAFPLFSSFTIGVSERFHILSHLFLMLFVPFGIILVLKFFANFFSVKLYSKVLLFAFFAIPFFLFVKNYPKVNLSQLSLGNDFSRNILSVPSSNGLLILAGDAALFNTWYIHYAEHVRSDITLAHWPGIVGSDYLNSVQKEYDKMSDKEKAAQSFWRYLMKKKDISSIMGIYTEDPDLIWVPYGLVQQLIDKKDIPSGEVYVKKNNLIWSKMRVPTRSTLKSYEKNLTSVSVLQEYAHARVNAGAFLFSQFKDRENGIKYLEEALKIDPTYAQAYGALSLMQYEDGKCLLAQASLRNAIMHDPTELKYYTYIPIVEKNCSQKVIDSTFRDYYTKKFHFSPNIFQDKVSTTSAK